MTYTHLLFDLDHTLLDFDQAEEVALTQLLLSAGVDDVTNYKAVYRLINKQLWQELEQGLVTKQELADARFYRLFAHFGTSVDGHLWGKRYETFLSQQGQTYTGAQALLSTLKQLGYKLYAATNGIAVIQKGRLEQSGLTPCFEQVFISEEVGYPKPDGRFFGAIAEQIADFSPETSLMIGDNQLADIKGAGDVGIDTVFYNPNHLALVTGVCPTYTVSDYEALLEILDK